MNNYIVVTLTPVFIQDGIYTIITGNNLQEVLTNVKKYNPIAVLKGVFQADCLSGLESILNDLEAVSWEDTLDAHNLLYTRLNALYKVVEPYRMENLTNIEEGNPF